MPWTRSLAGSVSSAVGRLYWVWGAVLSLGMCTEAQAQCLSPPGAEDSLCTGPLPPTVGGDMWVRRD